MEQLDQIKWTQDLSVGVTRMDEQHKRLILMINRLLRQPDATTRSEPISDLINDMTGYARDHFQAEEEMLSEHGYPRLEYQQNMHRAFRRKIVDLCTATAVGVPEVPQALLTYLREWLVHHIINEDMKYKSFFEDLGLTK
jgi:hemerythrin